MSLQSKVLNRLRKMPGVWVIKVEVANERGCPDILCCVGGRFCAIEIKEGKDCLSAIQVEQLNLIRKAGGAAAVITNFEEFETYLLCVQSA